MEGSRCVSVDYEGEAKSAPACGGGDCMDASALAKTNEQLIAMCAGIGIDLPREVRDKLPQRVLRQLCAPCIRDDERAVARTLLQTMEARRDRIELMLRDLQELGTQSSASWTERKVGESRHKTHVQTAQNRNLITVMQRLSQNEMQVRARVKSAEHHVEVARFIAAGIQQLHDLPTRNQDATSLLRRMNKAIGKSDAAAQLHALGVGSLDAAHANLRRVLESSVVTCEGFLDTIDMVLLATTAKAVAAAVPQLNLHRTHLTSMQQALVNATMPSTHPMEELLAGRRDSHLCVNAHLWLNLLRAKTDADLYRVLQEVSEKAVARVAAVDGAAVIRAWASVTTRPAYTEADVAALTEALFVFDAATAAADEGAALTFWRTVADVYMPSAASAPFDARLGRSWVRSIDDDIRGGIRSFLRVRPRASDDETNCPGGVLTVPNDAGVFYSVVPSAMTSNQEAFEGRPGVPGLSLVADRFVRGVRKAKSSGSFHGNNIVMLMYGHSGSGKTYLSVGDVDDASGVVTPGFLTLAATRVQQMLEGTEHDVTSVHLRVVDVAPDTYATFTMMGGPKHSRVYLMRRDGTFDTRGAATNASGTEEPFVLKTWMHDFVHSGKSINIDDVASLTAKIMEVNRQRKEAGRIMKTPNNPVSSRSHLFMSLEFKSGERSLGVMTVLDAAGAESPIDILRSTVFPTRSRSAIQRNIGYMMQAASNTASEQLTALQTMVESSIRKTNGEVELPVRKDLRTNWYWDYGAAGSSDRSMTLTPVGKAEAQRFRTLQMVTQIIGNKTQPSYTERMLVVTNLQQLLVSGFWINETLLHMQWYMSAVNRNALQRASDPNLHLGLHSKDGLFPDKMSDSNNSYNPRQLFDNGIRRVNNLGFVTVLDMLATWYPQRDYAKTTGDNIVLSDSLDTTRANENLSNTIFFVVSTLHGARTVFKNNECQDIDDDVRDTLQLASFLRPQASARQQYCYGGTECHNVVEEEGERKTTRPVSLASQPGARAGSRAGIRATNPGGASSRAARAGSPSGASVGQRSTGSAASPGGTSGRTARATGASSGTARPARGAARRARA